MIIMVRNGLLAKAQLKVMTIAENFGTMFVANYIVAVFRFTLMANFFLVNVGIDIKKEFVNGLVIGKCKLITCGRRLRG